MYHDSDKIPDVDRRDRVNDDRMMPEEDETEELLSIYLVLEDRETVNETLLLKLMVKMMMMMMVWKEMDEFQDLKETSGK